MTPQRRRIMTVIAVALAVVPAGRLRAEGAPSAQELMRSADRARGGLERGISWTVTVTTTEDHEKSERAYLVKALGNDAYVETTAPPRSKGELMLFNDRTIWYMKPGLRKPVSISARQRLSGQAANGDIASTNYARDYEGVASGEEKIAGEDAYRIDLKAKASNVTYDKIRYWVSKSRRLALKAEFQTLSGTPFKIATFEYKNRMAIGGVDSEFISAMTITDAAFPENVTVIHYSSPRAEEHAGSLFNVNNLVR